jgi:hypothetical protein
MEQQRRGEEGVEVEEIASSLNTSVPHFPSAFKRFRAASCNFQPHQERSTRSLRVAGMKIRASEFATLLLVSTVPVTFSVDQELGSHAADQRLAPRRICASYGLCNWTKALPFRRDSGAIADSEVLD